MLVVYSPSEADETMDMKLLSKAKHCGLQCFIIMLSVPLLPFFTFLRPEQSLSHSPYVYSWVIHTGKKWEDTIPNKKWSGAFLCNLCTLLRGACQELGSSASLPSGLPPPGQRWVGRTVSVWRMTPEGLAPALSSSLTETCVISGTREGRKERHLRKGISPQQEKLWEKSHSPNENTKNGLARPQRLLLGRVRPGESRENRELF